MIRVLFIGRQAPDWASAMRSSLGPQIELDTQTMPAAGLRHFDQTPPDAVVLIDPTNSARAETLARAIRERPVGQLIAIIAVAPVDARSAELADDGLVDEWLAPENAQPRLPGAIFEALGLDCNSPSIQPAPPAYFTEKTYFIEEIDEPEDPGSTQSLQSTQFGESAPGGAQSFMGFSDLDGFSDKPRHMSHADIFPSSGSRLHDLNAVQGHLSASAIQEKLQAVRHRDYFAILELRPGAEGALIREAFHRLYAQFDPDQLDFSLAHRFEAELAEIRDALEDAWAVLGDPRLREAYLTHAIRS